MNPSPQDQRQSDLPSRRQVLKYAGIGATLTAAGPIVASSSSAAALADGACDRAWLAGDHHVHSEWSVGWDESTDPPTPIRGGDAIYPIQRNAMMGRQYGLSWMMCTDHGGPNHSKVNLEQAYPELLKSRGQVPEVLQFWGMEFDAPALDHHTLMIPRGNDEARILYELERAYAKRDAWPTDPARDTEPKMVEFLKAANQYSPKPLVIAHHASRSATGLGVWGQTTPHEFRAGNDVAPEVYVGFEGSPGHQAGPLVGGARGAYSRHPTHGGFDQMAAVVGGLWDSLLGDGRRWWITATSDSHVNYTDGGADFWPGQYSKTYVHAARRYSDIMDGIRNGRMFVVTGDLVRSLDVTVESESGRRAGMGGVVAVRRGDEVSIDISFRPLGRPNANGDLPQVDRVDLIVGEVTGETGDPDNATNPTTRVVRRWGRNDWRRSGGKCVMRHTLKDVERTTYVRVRGTNTDEMEPQMDGLESPWGDLWFYSNPVFVTTR